MNEAQARCIISTMGKISLTLIPVLLSASLLLLSAAPKQKKPTSPCGQPPELIPATKPSKESRAKMHEERLQGSIAAEISESGDVVAAKVIHASSDKAGKFLLDLVKAMKFKPRPGCGLYRTQFNFSLAE